METSFIIAHFFLGPFMFILACFCLKFPPKKPNHFYGYRTSMSMKNQQTWETANFLSSYMFLIISFMTFLIQVIGVLLNLNFDTTYLSATIFLVLGLLMGCLYIEKKLRTIFDEDGNKKKQ